MQPEDFVNSFSRYTTMIENAFDFYESKLSNHVKIERQNNNNPIIVSQINLIIHSLESIKKHLTSNIGFLFDKHPSPKADVNINMGLFRSILNQYGKDLDRGIVYLENEYEYYLREHDILKEEIDMVNEVIDIIKHKCK